MGHTQPIPWQRNFRPQGHNMNKNNYYGSPWSSQASLGSENYWCETCDKGFMTSDLLEKHKLQHQKCNIDGCQFVAHPKVITKHIQMQHATGLYKRIGKLDNPEEIKKWRDERKKRYPTKENIEKKQAEIKEKIKRGEKMGLKRDRRGLNNDKLGFQNKRQKTLNHYKHNKSFNNKKINSQLPINKRPVKNKTDQTVPPKEETRKLQPFRGIQDLVIDDSINSDTPEEFNVLIEEDEDDNDVKTEIKEVEIVSKPIVCGALTSLICNYESTDEEDMEENTKQATIKLSKKLDGVTAENRKINLDINNDVSIGIKCEKLSNKKAEVSKPENNSSCHNESDNESGPEEQSITKIEPITNDDLKSTKCLQSKNERLQRHDKLKSRHRVVKLKRKLPSTLLEKLLHKEIQHERNVILQCIRHVVKNNYFDKN
ncbi:nuclear fragile X mental retardation-interacting protein 1 isoform X2 [Melitaea cinxia]|nr:nuclear fragile X mental retardation-interacting protein 1 isoform X2 [Melitaea cinxia]